MDKIYRYLLSAHLLLHLLRRLRGEQQPDAEDRGVDGGEVEHGGGHPVQHRRVPEVGGGRAGVRGVGDWRHVVRVDQEGLDGGEH